MMSAVVERLETTARSGVPLSEFGTWMASEQRRIYLLCRRLLQDPDEATSTTQDVFLKAYRALCKSADLGSELDNPEKWITRIAVNACLDRLRSKSWRIWQRRPAPQDEETILEMTSRPEPDAESQVFAQQIQRRLELGLAKLSDRQRAVFSLRHYDDMSLDDIAQLLRVDVGTVKAHLFRATSKLRDELRDVYGASMGRKALAEDSQ